MPQSFCFLAHLKKRRKTRFYCKEFIVLTEFFIALCYAICYTYSSYDV